MPDENYRRENLILEYEKHNQEMKKIRTYIRGRKQKNDFEYEYLNSVERYLDYGMRACARLGESRYETLRKSAFAKGCVCHGEYNQHNILIQGTKTEAVNFDHFCFDVQVADMSQFMRKILEKHNWDPVLADQMIGAYSQIKPMEPDEYYHLAIRLSYPEKFWKIANFYYNNNKAFLSARHLEKLKQQLASEKRWINFVNSIFSNFLLG